MKWTAAAFAAVVSYLLLAYVAGFSVRQSIVLALLMAWLVGAIAEIAEIARPARRKRFSPYYVRVDPNWYDLLLDFKLISKPEEWHTLRESFETLPSTEYRVLRSGFCFTIVNQSEDFERTLIYANHHQVFVSEVDFQAELDGA